jgi:hypothetical protein
MPIPDPVRLLRLHAASLRSRLGDTMARRAERRRYRTVGCEIAASRGETDHLLALAEECQRSYQADRADSALVDAWVLPLVTVRGIAARAVLRHRIARGHRQLRIRYETLGREAATGVAQPAGARPRALAEEAGRFGRTFWNQLRPAIFPKAPALAGLTVGWWIANTYTDSRWKSLARSIGIGSGGTTVVSGDTYRAMRFWLPLLAAAICAYAGDRIFAAIRGREHPEAGSEQ